ncbi:RagB/SusD family nutrient uptake outer membrane protein [Chitinophaga horti]|uniref:RagB/SusD family nutrient uptake outer membrane protein n=1 Tax=Chitinophaga horti TaxID=2920382 RepID=A0ABY6J3U3_9BACT|nr:RagB/SusD family nutrient uptake outer membrane protein [Chitinophaga horti]UYQ94338.1 RagB/SusD family nutrient uptake outer membrane protein [Chitinophaga horti]
MRHIKIALVCTLLALVSCKKFLDVVPDNVATLDNAFRLRNEAEKYLFTCYSYLPWNGDNWFNPGFMSGDEIWLPQTDQATWHAAFRIAQGMQNANAPYFDDWSGARKGSTSDVRRDPFKVWRAIRHCNIFLENLNNPNKVPDITIDERQRWIGEAEFLKAFYHYYMLRQYGPIPVIDKNVSIEGEEAVPNVRREPVDTVVNYISRLLDAAAEKLPEKIVDENTQMGRITKPIALAVKAKLWAMAASPLFNGNPDYANFKDKEGLQLFNPAFDPKKWEMARDAAKAAIEAAEANGHVLYEYKVDVLGLNDTTKRQLSIRNSFTQRWAPEHIWAMSNSYFVNEALCAVPFERGSNTNRSQLRGLWAAPMKIAKMFYTHNGVPIDEDKTLNFTNYSELRTATVAERFNIEKGFVTARLNFDREPRFYADLGFDGGVWYMKDSPSGKDENTYYIKAKNGEKAGFGDYLNYNETGYFIKKLLHWESTTAGTAAPTFKTYPWAEIRLADIYLLYAEALNEVEGGSLQAIEYIDKVRTRAGLKGVVESWSNFSTNPAKYTTKDGLRQIIHRERNIELVFEGQRFWDLRRWKEAAETLNADVTGWNSFGKTAENYYKERVVYTQSFIAPRDYFWPIGVYDIRRNPRLVENPGW